MHDPGQDPLFKLQKPVTSRVPFVFNSPHSGRNYPVSFIAQSDLEPKSLRRSEDFLVDELFASVVPLGAPLLIAEFPRAWLDVNREPYELDPAMFDGPLPEFVNQKSTRVTSGLGTIARIVSETQNIYPSKLSVEEGLSRITQYYLPYHAALRKVIAGSLVQFGHSVLVDCHSMPSATTNSLSRRKTPIKADFVLGDRFGTSCSPTITNAAAEFLGDLGYRVEINKPYAGGFITEHYGRPHNGLHAIQIEINRALYMNEENLTKSQNFDQLSADLKTFASRLISTPDKGLEASMPLAAE